MIFPFAVCIMRKGELCGTPILCKTFPTAEEAHAWASYAAPKDSLAFVGQVRQIPGRKLQHDTQQ